MNNNLKIQVLIICRIIFLSEYHLSEWSVLFKYFVLTSNYCLNKSPQTQALETTHISYPTVLQVRWLPWNSLGGEQGVSGCIFLPWSLKGSHFSCLFCFLGTTHIPPDLVLSCHSQDHKWWPSVSHTSCPDLELSAVSSTAEGCLVLCCADQDDLPKIRWAD